MTPPRTLRVGARVEALQLALDAAQARAGAEHLAAVPGVVGTLLDLVSIDPGWERAVEAALGEALAAVVVRDVDAAVRALQALRGAGASGGVLALGLLVDAPAAALSVGEPVRRHVHAGRRDVDELLDRLLANAGRLDDLDAAIAAAASQPGAVIVTAAGDRLGAASWRVGGAAGAVTAAALAEAEERRAAADRALAAARADEATAVDAAATSRRHAAEVADRLDANDRRFTASSEALARAQSDRREIGVELDPLVVRCDELVAIIAADDERIAELEAVVPRLEAGESAEAEAVRNQQTLRSTLDARAAVLGGTAPRPRRAPRRAARAVRRSRPAARRDGAPSARRRGGAQQRGAAPDVDRADLAALARLAGFVEDRRAVIDRVHANLSEQRREHSERVGAVTARLDAERDERAQTERRLDEVRERARRAEVEEAEARLRLESAVEMLRHDCDVEPEVAEAAEPPELPDGVNPHARVRELERELRLLGPINPLALEEFSELQQRHAFLEEQLDDVRTTRRELARVIKAVDHEIQTVFAAAYADVADHFAALFANLFPGGTGRLVLTQPDNLLETGIEVEAKPGGKNIKKLSLLSGGERSLTALAFLFAVFRSRPSPFYVMDEVEAALDDVNLHRFLALVAEFRDEAQLLIVSHQKRTMEAADCLFGVTMQPGGSSKVLSERATVG